MKAVEVQIIRFCDFCREKTRSNWTCGVCSRDICDLHRLEVMIPQKKPRNATELLRNIANEARTLAGSTGTFYGVGAQSSVCPQCSTRPLVEIAAALERNCDLRTIGDPF